MRAYVCGGNVQSEYENTCCGVGVILNFTAL